MNKYLLLYDALTSLFPDTLTSSFGRLSEEDKRAYAIIQKGLSPTNRLVSSGVYGTNKTMYKILINGGDTDEDDYAVLDFAEKVFQVIQKTFNYRYTDPDTGKSIVIQNIKVLNDLNALGVNRINYTTYSLNIIIDYSGGN